MNLDGPDAFGLVKPRGSKIDLQEPFSFANEKIIGQRLPAHFSARSRDSIRSTIIRETFIKISCDVFWAQVIFTSNWVFSIIDCLGRWRVPDASRPELMKARTSL